MSLTKLIKEFIFEEERPFKSCHASTLLVLLNGDILVSWFGGTEEGASDVGIWLSKRVNGRWTFPKKVSVQENIPHWNPVLFQSAEGSIYLFYKVGYKIPEWITMVVKSDDHGDTWTAPRSLVEGDIGGRGPVKNKVIILNNGIWLAPASIEDQYWDAFVDYSVDQGKTWTKSKMVPLNRSDFKGKGVIQPALWESEPGMVHMVLRSTEGAIYRSDSKDAGKTWFTAYPTSLPNNNSGIDLTRLENGILALVYNPVKENWGARSPLVISLSYDNGDTWTDTYVLEDEKAGCEYSYPAIVSKDSEIYITYTWNRQRIVLWKFLLD